MGKFFLFLTALALVLLLAAVTGCGVNVIKPGVDFYCGEPVEARMSLRVLLAEKTAPHVVAIHCGEK